MYPNLYYACKELFGMSIPALKAVNSVGFFIALAFIPGAWMWRRELKRKEQRGELTCRVDTVLIGKPVSKSRVLLHLVLGFAAGYKLLYLALQQGSPANTSAFLFSTQGTLTGGLIAGGLWALVTWQKGKEEESETPEWQEVKIWPHECVSKGILVAGISGVIGAKLFGIAENWAWFVKAPLTNLFSSEGFAFLGGLIVATVAMWAYHYRWGVQRMHMCDALVPSLLLSYSLGRLGCHIGGDGDWGIANRMPKPFSWLPDWLWAYDYPHNVANIGVYIKNCTWDNYCYHLAVPVYPTPLYELVAGLLLFGLLLLIRRNFTTAGYASATYMLLCSTERFWIEKIRVDVRYSMFGFHPTQAEILSVLLFAGGIALFFLAPYLNANKIPKKQQSGKAMLAGSLP